VRPSWQDEHKKAIDRVTKEIVESYESELVRLRREVTEAHNVARQVGTSDDAARHVRRACTRNTALSLATAVFLLVRN